MKYRIESIGAAFSQKDIDTLATHFSSMSDGGWEFHSVFSIEKTGCFGSSEGRTYLAVFRRTE
jgi:hypothetical protein